MSESVIIFAEPGVGKTCYMTFLLNQIAFDDDRTALMQGEIAWLNAHGFNLKTPNHCASANYNCTFKKFGQSDKTNYEIDAARLRIWSKENPNVVFTFPYQAIGIDEAQKYFSAYKELDPEICEFFEERRHNGLDIYMTCQRAIRIHKNIREISRFVEVLNVETVADRYGLHFKTIFTVREFPGNAEVEEYLEKHKKPAKGLYTERTVIAPYNVFETYDSRGCQAEFFRGNLNKDFSLKEKRVYSKSFKGFYQYIKDNTQRGEPNGKKERK